MVCFLCALIPKPSSGHASMINQNWVHYLVGALGVPVILWLARTIGHLQQINHMFLVAYILTLIAIWLSFPHVHNTWHTA